MRGSALPVACGLVALLLGCLACGRRGAVMDVVHDAEWTVEARHGSTIWAALSIASAGSGDPASVESSCECVVVQDAFVAGGTLNLRVRLDCAGLGPHVIPEIAVRLGGRTETISCRNLVGLCQTEERDGR